MEEAEAFGSSVNNYVANQSANMGEPWNNLNVQEKERLRLQWASEEIDYTIQNGDTRDGSLSSMGVSVQDGIQIGIRARRGFGSFDGNTIYSQEDAQIALEVINHR